MEPNFGMWAPIIIGLPLLGSIVLLFFGRRIGRWSGWVASAALALAFVFGVIAFAGLIASPDDARSDVVRLFEWIVVGDFAVGADLLVDELSIVMVLVVTGVGSLIHLYSIDYMRDDLRYSRYFAFLNLFAAAMLLLVLADNLLLLYVGWEGVGLCSYLLIGFWFERSSAHNAAKKAFIVNRIGDFAFLLGILLLASRAGLAVAEVNDAAAALAPGIATIAALLLFAGATGKSAQIPLYVWLPDAMEGPTPVSALIHAATMVTAGVYVVARFSPVFEASGGAALAVVGWIGALTALWAALMAAAEYDIKRVLAYSTVSQLGYMFLAHGVQAYSAGMFHLVTHAFFKALMFLGAGAVMHALAGQTDMRKMGGLRARMPITALTFAAGVLAISGIFPFAGFFSKDAILASAWIHSIPLWGIGLVTAVLTAFYMGRLYFSVFEGRSRLAEDAHPHDAPLLMAVALVPLAILSVIGGGINLPGALTLEHFLEPVVGESEVPTGTLPWVLGGVALLVAIAGLAAAWWFYLSAGGEQRRRALQARAGWFVTAARNKFYVDELYGRYIVLPAKKFAADCAYYYDAGVIDGTVDGLAGLIARSAQGLRRVQSGYVRNYAAAFLLGVVIVFSVVMLRTTL